MTREKKLNPPDTFQNEPIAVIGMGCRFPGADSPSEFWRVLCEGKDMVADVPEERRELRALYDPEPQKPGKIVTRQGGFLKNIDQFDPAFFGISPREAEVLDPQQRLLLETAWEAFEDAGVAPQNLASRRAGVFVGMWTNDYEDRMIRATDKFDLYFTNGGGRHSASGRLSFTFNLQGPSMTVDTACSSSLVAVHLACKSIRDGESDLALAGGVNLILHPFISIGYSRSKILSPYGRCRFGAENAQGYVRSEGAGMILLKKLHQALADGDEIYAVIRGSAVNNDGASSGLLVAPGVETQIAMLRRAYAEAGVEPAKVGYIEAHGTGTAAGDPVELGALGAVLGENRSQDQPCRIGSVKTNIGHTEAASGIAGLIKAVLCLQHRQIPPSLHFDRPNPKIDWRGLGFQMQQKLESWPKTDESLFAGVNSFGITGTNAHIVLEESPPPQNVIQEESILPADRSDKTASEAELKKQVFNSSSKESSGRAEHTLKLSAASEQALKAQAARYAEFIEKQTPELFPDICFSANSGRADFEFRLSAHAPDSQEMSAQLRRFINGERTPNLQTGQIEESVNPKIAFLFTGQGAQYAGMGKQLYETQPVFREALDRCAEFLEGELESPLLNVIFALDTHEEVIPVPNKSGGIQKEQRPLDSRLRGNDKLENDENRTTENAINQTAYTQPALFALEFALAELWQSWGVEPDMVLGHSVGEYVAACRAGVFSLEDGLKLIAARARLMQNLDEKGGMAVVFANREKVAEAVAPFADKVSIAALNGPENTVISGASEALQTIVEKFEEEKIKVKKLTVSNAFHSPLMEGMLDEFERIANEISFSSPKVPLVSNLTGRVFAPDEIPDAKYWRKHIRAAVNFSDGVKTLADEGCTIFLEMGPAPSLVSMAMKCVEPGGKQWLASLRKGKNDWGQLLNSLGALYVNGAAIDWRGFDKLYSRKRIKLPTYPFQRERYWIDESNPVAAHAGSKTRVQKDGHPLLGSRLRSALKSVQFESRISAKSPGFLNDHRFLDMAVFPAAGYLEMMQAAGRRVFGDEAFVCSDFLIREALPLSEDSPQALQTIITPENDGSYSVEIFGAPDSDDEAAEWALFLTAKLASSTGEIEESQNERDAFSETRTRCDQEISGGDFYARRLKVGAFIGENFQAIEKIFLGKNEAVALLPLAESAVNQAEDFTMHPALLDAGIQVFLACVPEIDAEIYLPIGCERFECNGAHSSKLTCHAQLHENADDDREMFKGDLIFHDENERQVAKIEKLRLKRADRTALLRMTQRNNIDNWLYEVVWRERALDRKNVQNQQPGAWVIFSENAEISESLSQRIATHGGECVIGLFSDSNGELPENATHVDFEKPDNFFELLQNAASQFSENFQGAIFFRGDESKEGTREELRARQKLLNQSLLHLVHSMDRLMSESAAAPKLCVVTHGAQAVSLQESLAGLSQASLWGLARVIMQEHPELKCKIFDLDASENPEQVAELVDDIFAGSEESQIAFRSGERFVARMIKKGAKDFLVPPDNQPFQLQKSPDQTFDKLSLQPISLQRPRRGEVEIQVHATGLNFRDVLNALGMYPGEAGPLGLECAGKISAVGEDVEQFQVGDEVVAMAFGSFSSNVITRAELVVKKPGAISFAQAATIPVTFLTAHYGLNRLAKMQPGERVLIHAGAGGVGLSAIQLAKQAGAEIFATAGSEKKRDLLKSLGVRHVFNSRTLDFADEIMAVTDGAGVDIVLNSLAGEFIDKSVSVLAPNGRFIEIGKTDIWSEKHMAAEKPGVSYFVIALDHMAKDAPELVGDLFAELMGMFSEGALLPLPLQEYAIQAAPEAFRFMSQAKHIGKIVLTQKHRPEKDEFTTDGTWLITGGLGGLGLRTAKRLVERGVRHLALTSRGEPSEAARGQIDELEKRGAKISVLRGDISKLEDAAGIFDEIAENMPPLRGIVHAAGMLRDGLLRGQSWQNFDDVFAPKILGAWNIHKLSQNLDLDAFVLFSSVTALLGTKGQGNYAAANAFMDGLAHHRRALGLPALSVNWGPWSEIGMAAAMENRDQQRWGELGISMISPESGLDLFEKCLTEDAAQIAVLPANWKSFFSNNATPNSWPFFHELRPKTDPTSAPKNNQASRNFGEELLQTPPEKRRNFLKDAVRQQVIHILGLAVSAQPPAGKPLKEQGLDSLMAVELGNALASDLGESLPGSLVFDYPTIDAITNFLAEETFAEALSNGKDEPEQTAKSADEDAKIAELEQLSDEDAEALLAEKLQAFEGNY